jgi:hypothetical protein
MIYVVTGRCRGDDEDSVLEIKSKFKNEAMSDFTDIMDEDNRRGTEIYVNEVMGPYVHADEFKALEKEYNHQTKKMQHGCYDFHCNLCDGDPNA